MGIVRTFVDLGPPPRTDGLPWTSLRIDESAAFEGPWATIDTVTLAVESDPASPAPVAATTENATLEAAYYRLTWIDADGDTQPGSIIYYSGTTAPWRPTVQEVASYVTRRTKIPGGILAGTFTTQTEPTAAQVELLIGQAVDHVSSAIGIEPCNGQLQRDARAAAALYAAILVEVSFFPETTSNQGSSAVRLESLFNGRIKTLAAAVEAECGQGGGGGGDAPGSGALPAGHFSDGRPLIGPGCPLRW